MTEIESLGKRGLRALREAVGRRVSKRPPRWNPDPKDVQKSVVRLVLSLVEFLRKILERQTLRRMDQGTLTPAEIEALGVSLMRIEETVHELANQFGIDPEELSLDLGPLGKT
jgi:gas vesicle protein GvpK